MWLTIFFHGVGWWFVKVEKNNCQGFIAITCTKEIDFIVYNNETCIETIKCEEERWHKETLLF